jgi:hypothetical protein
MQKTCATMLSNGLEESQGDFHNILHIFQATVSEKRTVPARVSHDVREDLLCCRMAENQLHRCFTILSLDDGIYRLAGVMATTCIAGSSMAAHCRADPHFVREQVLYSSPMGDRNDRLCR